MSELYSTDLGKIVCEESAQYLATLDESSVDLIMTSPPYALNDKKEYGNPNPDEYIDWFLKFCPVFHRILKDTGSLIVNIGGAWNPGVPTRSLYRERLLIRIVDEYKFHLAQDFLWLFPPRITGTTEYATRRKIRARDSAEQIWWLSKTPDPKADITNVLYEYSESFSRLLRAPSKLNVTRHSHTGGEIHTKNLKDNSGRQPTNWIYASNTDAGTYVERCEAKGLTPHPARFPLIIPLFFINMLTNEGDLVVDPFAGSCTTGYVAEQHNRRWLCVDMNAEWLQTGIEGRFTAPSMGRQQTIFS